jgi:transposase
MGRADLERLSKDDLIELVLRLQRPEKTSRTSSKPPSTDRKERREQARPGGAKPGHEGHSRTLAQDPDRVIEHRPACCPDCGLVLPPDLPAETVSTHEHIELPPVRPVVEQHRRLAVTCPACQARVAAPRPAGAASTPFGARLHATAVYLKCFQALSYERLQRALSDLFGLTISQGGLMAMLRRAQARFAPGREAALSALRRAAVVACDETGVRIEGSNSYHWVFRCDDAVVHHAAPTRGASVVREIMDGHRPAVWLSDRYSAQLRPLFRPARPRRSAADLPGASGARRRLCARSRRRPGRVPPQAVARLGLRAGARDRQPCGLNDQCQAAQAGGGAG